MGCCLSSRLWFRDVRIAMGSSVDGRRSSSYDEARQGMFAARMYIGRGYEVLHTLLFVALFSGGRRSGR